MQMDRRARNERCLTFLCYGIASFLNLALAGCSSIATLPDGTATAMSSKARVERSALVVNSEALPIRLSYHPAKTVAISYDIHSLTGFEESGIDNIDISEVKGETDKLMITTNSSHGSSTITVIDRYGRVLAFNTDVRDPSCGLTAIADEKEKQICTANMMSKAHTLNRKAHLEYTNTRDLVFPHYESGLVRVGGELGVVKNENGEIIVHMIYRGTTRYRGRDAVVIDLVVFGKTAGTPIVYGFNVIDPATNLPLLFWFSSGLELRGEQIMQ
jgi:hypothetical protein